MQGRAQAEWGPAPSKEGGEEIPPPQHNWVVKNLKLDFNKTNRKGYVQTGGGFNPKGRVRGLLSPTQKEAQLARVWGKDSFPTGPQPTFLAAKQEAICPGLGKGAPLTSWGGGG